MKFDTLRSIGHNIADSLGSGIGLLIGVYEMDVFGEAAGAPDGTPSPSISCSGPPLAGWCPTPSLSPSQSIGKRLDPYAQSMERQSRIFASYLRDTPRSIESDGSP